jgi:hypothetical protein
VRRRPSLGFLLTTLHLEMTVLGRAVKLSDANAWSFAVLPVHARLLVITEEIARLTQRRKSASVLKLRDVIAGLRCPTPAEQQAELDAAYAIVLDSFDDVDMF